jgi:hypothetical protein
VIFINSFYFSSFKKFEFIVNSKREKKQFINYLIIKTKTKIIINNNKREENIK